MSKRETFERYRLIIKKLRKQASTFAEIAYYLEEESDLQGYDFSISKRTFKRDLEDIASLFNIDIVYDFSRKLYYIEYDEEPEVNERIFEAFDIFNALNISERLSDFILFEKRRPQGTENLYGLLHAIKNQVQIVFRYRKFWEDEITRRTTEPYALKEFRNRWYVLAKDLGDSRVKSFALDRLSDVEITTRKFRLPNDFNSKEHFKHSFGIISPNGQEPLDIILSFDPFQGKYIKTLPLHESQEILIDNNEEIRIKLKLYITRDFVMEILSHGDSVKVLQPSGLIDELKNTYRQALDLYK